MSGDREEEETLAGSNRRHRRLQSEVSEAGKGRCVTEHLPRFGILVGVQGPKPLTGV